MRNVKPTMPTMRTDFEFSTRKVRLPNASTLGYGKYEAEPGDWVQFRPDSESGPVAHGRVVGCVTEAVRRHPGLMVITLVGNLDNPAMRWIDPALVVRCDPGPPRRVLEFICGAWDDPQAICDAVHNGFIEDYQRAAIEEVTGKPYVALNDAPDLVLRITTAYEQGFGHAARSELSNPYEGGTVEHEAWDAGREQGQKRATNAPALTVTGRPLPKVQRVSRMVMSHRALHVILRESCTDDELRNLNDLLTAKGVMVTEAGAYQVKEG